METVYSLGLATIFCSICGPVYIHLWQLSNLHMTAQTLIYEMRYAQEAAQVTGQFGQIRFSPSTPEYTVYVGNQKVKAVHFRPGVTYKDGYLQLGTSTVSYDVQGNCQVGGVIRLVSGVDEVDIQLYQGVGLQGTGGL